MGETHSRENLDLALLPWGKLVERQLETLRLDAKPSRHRMCRGHPHIGVGCVLDAQAHRNALQLLRQDVEHSAPRHKRSGAERNRELVASAIVVPDDLGRPSRNLDAVESSDLGRVEVVESSVDVPAVEAGVALLGVLLRDDSLVEGGVRGVLELGFGEAVVVVDNTVADKLDLGDAGDSLEIGVEDRLLGLAGLVVTVAVVLRRRVKVLCERR